MYGRNEFVLNQIMQKNTSSVLKITKFGHFNALKEGRKIPEGQSNS